MSVHRTCWLIATVVVSTLGASSPLAAQNAVRTPVLLVPGWGDGSSQLLPLHTRFVLDGWPSSHVVMLDFVDPVGSNVGHAVEIGAAIDRLLEATGADAVDVVAHSMGGLAVRHLLIADARDARVRRVVFLATPHNGSVVAYLAWGEGGAEMVPGSPFLERLNRVDPVPKSVRALNIRTRADLQVLPQTSSTLGGADHADVCCPSHSGLLDDGPTFVRIRGFLLSP